MSACACRECSPSAAFTGIQCRLLTIASCRWARSASGRFAGQHATTDLIELDGFEQGLEVAFTEALVALALNDLEEDGADGVLREDLQQEPLTASRGTIDQNAVLLEQRQILAVAGHPGIDSVV